MTLRTLWKRDEIWGVEEVIRGDVASKKLQRYSLLVEGMATPC